MLITENNKCCDTIEIICPSTKEELARLVHFLYHGEIQCDDVFDYFKSQEDLSKIFGFPEDFNIECQIAILLDDPKLSSIIDTALYEEIVNSVDDAMITQSSEIDFIVQDIVCLNFEYANDSMLGKEMFDQICQTEVKIDLNNNLIHEIDKDDEHFERYDALFNGSSEIIEEETVENTVDEINMANNYERNLPAHGLMVDKGCPTEVEIELNSNLVFVTDIGHRVDENFEGVVMNETKKSEMQGVNGNIDKFFESECADENDVTVTFEESKNVDKPIETGKAHGHSKPKEPENNVELMVLMAIEPEICLLNYHSGTKGQIKSE